MAKTWIYVLMIVAIFGMIVVIGSVATADKGTVADPARLPGTSGSDSISTTGYVYPNYATPPNFQWLAYTYGTDTTFTTIYTVPSGYRLQIDDVWISFRGSSGYSENYIYRGPSSTYNFLASIQLGPKDHAEIAAKNVILNSGESLRIRSYYSGSSVTMWTITGHWV
jgi:hypothetical protein